MLRHLRNTRPRDLTATHAQLRVFFEEAQKQLDLVGKVAYNSDNGGAESDVVSCFE